MVPRHEAHLGMFGPSCHAQKTAQQLLAACRTAAVQGAVRWEHGFAVAQAQSLSDDSGVQETRPELHMSTYESRNAELGARSLCFCG